MTAMDVLEERYRTFFRFVDVNKDKVLSHADVDKLLVNLCRKYSANRKEYEQIQRELDTWWREMEPMTVDGKISEDRYVNLMKNSIQEDPEKFKDSINKCYSLLFDIMDRNKDNKISQVEFLNYFAAFKMHKKITIQKIFQQLDLNMDDYITRDEWILAHVNYMTCDSPYFDHGFLYKVPK